MFRWPYMLPVSILLYLMRHAFTRFDTNLDIRMRYELSWNRLGMDMELAGNDHRLDKEFPTVNIRLT